MLMGKQTARICRAAIEQSDVCVHVLVCLCVCALICALYHLLALANLTSWTMQKRVDTVTLRSSPVNVTG